MGRKGRKGLSGLKKFFQYFIYSIGFARKPVQQEQQQEKSNGLQV